MAQPRNPVPPSDLAAQSAGAFLGALLTDLLAVVAENAAWFNRDHDEEALHQLRISVRKTRALIDFLSPLVRTEPILAAAGARLRRLAAPFGEVRDLDVLLASISDGAAPIHPRHSPALRAALERERAAAARRSMKRLTSGKWERALEELGKAARAGIWRSTVGAQESALLVVGHELDTWWWGITALWEGLVELPEERRHRVRIAAKKLRYLTELTAPLYVPREEERAAATARLKAMQDHLGVLQDTVAAAQSISAHGFQPLAPDPLVLAAGLAGAELTRLELEEAGPYWR